MKFKDIVETFSNRQEILVYNITNKTVHMATPKYLLKSKEVDGEADVLLVMKDEIESQIGTGSCIYEKESIIRVEVI